MLRKLHQWAWSLIKMGKIKNKIDSFLESDLYVLIITLIALIGFTLILYGIGTLIDDSIEKENNFDNYREQPNYASCYNMCIGGIDNTDYECHDVCKYKHEIGNYLK